MSEELRQAAERVDLGYEDDPQYVRDAEALARAYLAANPSDSDEPVTADWLASLYNANPQMDIGKSPFGNTVRLRGEGILNVSFVPRTRGQLRLLCQGLGIALNEVPAS